MSKIAPEINKSKKCFIQNIFNKLNFIILKSKKFFILKAKRFYKN